MEMQTQKNDNLKNIENENVGETYKYKKYRNIFINK